MILRAAWLLLLAALGGRASQDMNEAPGGEGCKLDYAGYASGLHHVQIRLHGQVRLFLLFVPTAYAPHVGVPLWLLAPGAYETPGRFLHVSGMLQFAEAYGFAFAVLQGTRIEGMNVGLHGREIPQLPDDVEYTRAVLRDVSQKICVNMGRIRCTGYSRGARFCSRLASELSHFVGGIAPVAGLRFPDPNNSTRPMPIIAIHGTHDAINPYWGKGDPSYWHESVPDAVNRWAKFNKCKYSRWERKSEHVVLYNHFDCTEDASVVLVMVEGDGHTWPGSNAFVESQFGHTTHEVDANEVMRHFFMKHPAKSACHTAVEGELCFEEVKRVMREGLAIHPDWKQRLPVVKTFEDYQYELHVGILADCGRPCPRPDYTARKQWLKAPETTAAPATTAAPPNPEDTVQAIEGRWIRDTQPGRFTEVIRDGFIHWDIGPVTKITALGGGKFATEWQGSRYQAHLVEGELVWDDGDVWARDEGSDDPQSIFAKKVQEVPDLSGRSWRDLGRVHGSIALLASAGVFAAALLSLGAWRRHRLPLEVDCASSEDDDRGQLHAFANSI